MAQNKHNHPLFHILQAKSFFTTYAPSVRRYKHKLRGFDSAGRTVTFTSGDQAAIAEGVEKLCTFLKENSK